MSSVLRMSFRNSLNCCLFGNAGESSVAGTAGVVTIVESWWTTLNTCCHYVVMHLLSVVELHWSCHDGYGEDTFSGSKNDDAHEHVERVLDIVTLFNIPGVSHDVVMLRVFPITLTGAAKRWVDRLPPGTVDSWDLLKKTFIQRDCPPLKTAKQLEEIRNFKQEGDETLYQA
ncbi:hypothetical protein Tco_1083786 [Tanacetum coccineum]